MTDEATPETKPATTNKKPGRPPAIKPKLVVETPKPVEKVNTGYTEKPLVDAKQPEAEVSGKKCPNHPEARAVLYGMCTVCYDKLPKAEKRGHYLKARLYGSNTHNYPLELRRVWRREVALIEAGLWKRPLKTKAKTSLEEALSA
jgi:hypothetical protein